MLVALIGFLPTKGEGAIGALDYPAQERKDLAKKYLFLLLFLLLLLLLLLLTAAVDC